MRPWPKSWPSKLRRVAAIAPHPDDEVFVAGLLHRAHRGGANVTLICATRGERGWLFGKPAQPDRVAAIRGEELLRSRQAIGIDELVQLDLGDGEVSSGTAAILTAIDTADPDLVVSYDVDGGYGHRDHVAVARIVASCGRRWLRLAFPDGLWRQFGRRLARVSPDLISDTESPSGDITWELQLDERTSATKKAAAAAHTSQLTANGTFLFEQLEAEIFTRELYRDTRGHE